MKPVAADIPLLAPALRYRIGEGVLRHRPVECRIEDGNVWHVRQGTSCLLDRPERGTVVKRRQVAKRIELSGHRIVDQGRVGEPGTTVDDSVDDGDDLGRDLVDRRHGCRAVGPVHERELQARRAGVDDEDLAQNGQAQSRIAGSSSPCSRV